MKRTTLALAIVFAAAGAVQAQGRKKDMPPGQGIDWQGDWDAAVKEATARNVPLHVAVHKDNCIPCKEMSETVFTDPKIIELSRSFVNVVAHRETAHGDREVQVGKEKIKLCNEYYDIPCSVHVKGSAVMGRFFTGTFGTPSTVFCDPEGKELFKITGGLSGGELTKKMNEALSKVAGDKITLPQWQAARKFAEDGDAALAKGDAKKALEAYGKLGRMKGAAFKTMTDEANARANEAGEKALKEALALENVEEKKKALKKIVEDYKTLAASLEAKKELDALK